MSESIDWKEAIMSGGTIVDLGGSFTCNGKCIDWDSRDAATAQRQLQRIADAHKHSEEYAKQLYKR